jgi:signal transduction histidine kinase
MVQAISAVVTVVALVAMGAPAARRALVPVAVLVALLSLASTVEQLAASRESGSGFSLLELGALLGLAVLTARLAPVRLAAVVVPLVVVASAVLILRFDTPSSVLEAVGASAFFSLPALAAAGTGAYLRGIDARQARMAADVRRSQRLELARDLHDFVAHDVSGVVVLAQAAQAVAADAPRDALASLGRIEKAGLQALRSIDQALQLLRDADPDDGRPRQAPDAGQDGIAAIRALVERFRATSQAKVELALDRSLPPMPPEVADTAHRIVAEALTNVRRHAPDAGRVEVTLRQRDESSAPTLVVTVRDTGRGGARQRDLGPSHRGGFGLVALSERAEALGGKLAFGADDAGGWCVTGALPMPANPERTS